MAFKKHINRLGCEFLGGVEDTNLGQEGKEVGCDKRNGEREGSVGEKGCGDDARVKVGRVNGGVAVIKFLEQMSNLGPIC